MKQPLLSLGVAMLLILAGCQGLTNGTSPTDSKTPGVETASETKTQTVISEEDRLIWSLGLFRVDATPEPGGEFNSYVATEGHFRGQVSGVAVQFIAENGTVVSEVSVGNITAVGEKHWANTTVPMVPVYVVPKVEDWETPNMEFDEIDGIYITADGEFRPYELQDPANFTR